MSALTQRILVDTPATIRASWVDQDGASVAPSTPATVAVTRADGTVVLAANTAATVAANDVTRALTAVHTNNLDVLTAVWTDATGVSRATTHEVVGGYYVSVDELRAMTNLDDQTKFPNAKFVAAREWFETKFEQYTNRAFVPRYKRTIIRGSGTDTLLLADDFLRTMRAVSWDGTVLNADALANLIVESFGRIQHVSPSAGGGVDNFSSFPLGTEITVAYEYGLDRPPDDVVEAAKTAIRLRLLDDKTGLRDYAVQTDVGIIRYSRPGPGRPFGVPDVDEVANNWRLPVCA